MRAVFGGTTFCAHFLCGTTAQQRTIECLVLLRVDMDEHAGGAIFSKCSMHTILSGMVFTVFFLFFPHTTAQQYKLEIWLENNKVDRHVGACMGTQRTIQQCAPFRRGNFYSFFSMGGHDKEHVERAVQVATCKLRWR